MFSSNETSELKVNKKAITRKEILDVIHVLNGLVRPEIQAKFTSGKVGAGSDNVNLEFKLFVGSRYGRFRSSKVKVDVSKIEASLNENLKGCVVSLKDDYIIVKVTDWTLFQASVLTSGIASAVKNSDDIGEKEGRKIKPLEMEIEKLTRELESLKLQHRTCLFNIGNEASYRLSLVELAPLDSPAASAGPGHGFFNATVNTNNTHSGAGANANNSVPAAGYVNTNLYS